MLHVELQNFFFRHGIDLLHSESSPYYCGTCLPSPSANLLHLGLSADHLSGRFTTVMHKTCLCIFTCLVKDSQNAGYPIHKISPCQHLDKCTKYVCVNICYKKKWHMKLDENSPACYLRVKTEVPCLHGSQNVLVGQKCWLHCLSPCPQCVITCVSRLYWLGGWKMVGSNSPFILLVFKPAHFFFLPAPVKPKHGLKWLGWCAKNEWRWNGGVGAPKPAF